MTRRTQQQRGQLVNEARRWRCDICGEEDYWGPGWAWWGSLRDMDNGVIPFVQCPKHPVGGRAPLHRVYFCNACGKNIGLRSPPDTVTCSRCGHVNVIGDKVKA